jgi:CheY-like chemotaxis protein
MGGEIGVYSDQDKGSTFWFTLGLLKQHEGFRESLEPRTNLHGLHMLIVGGSPTNRTVLDHYLTSLGIRCECAEDGPMAVNLLRLAAKNSEPFDFAILDSTMLGIKGSKLASVIRQSRRVSSLLCLSLLWENAKLRTSPNKPVLTHTSRNRFIFQPRRVPGPTEGRCS